MGLLCEVSLMLIGLSGVAQAGKDATAQVLVETYHFWRLALATKMKEAALALDPIIDYCDGEYRRLSDIIDIHGPEKAKEFPEVRRLYQRMGTEVGRRTIDEDLWVKLLFEQMRAVRQRDWVISDVRFLNELRAIQKKGGFVIRIIRPGAGLEGEAAQHVSENELGDEDGLYDAILHNDGTLAELPVHLAKAMSELGRH
jgi:hypothetical protein